MAVPIRRGDEVVGSIWLEDLPPAARRAAGAESFARTVAHVEAVRIPVSQPTQEPAEASGRSETDAEADEAMRDQVVPGTNASRRETSVDAGRQEALWQRRDEPDAVEVFPAVTVLTVLLPEPAEAGTPPGPAAGGAAVAEFAADAVARVLEDATQTLEIPYLKVLGNCIVAAAGFSGDPGLAARAIAQAALALRDAGDQPAGGLRMGIDTGVVLGSTVGRGRRCYNLSGAATRRAAEMAQSAPPGGVQVTEFAYRHLSGAFLLRPRGAFYLHPEGEAAVYLLAGRI